MANVMLEMYVDIYVIWHLMTDTLYCILPSTFNYCLKLWNMETNTFDLNVKF